MSNRLMDAPRGHRRGSNEKGLSMTSRVIPVAPFVLTVFGATGDLARRKL
jgi:glucose-6-phosphate 1-dehydrogenase